MINDDDNNDNDDDDDEDYGVIRISLSILFICEPCCIKSEKPCGTNRGPLVLLG